MRTIPPTPIKFLSLALLTVFALTGCAPQNEVGDHGSEAFLTSLVEDTGAAVLPLFDGTLSSLEGPAANYLAMIKYNVEAIAAAGSNADYSQAG